MEAGNEPKAVTVAQAATQTGLTEKAIRRRIERGQLRTVKRAGRVLVLAVDLLDLDGGPERGTSGHGEPNVAPGGVAEFVAATLRLSERVEELARAKGELEAKAGAAEAERDQLRKALEDAQAQLIEVRAEVKQLEAAAATKGRWWRRRKDAPKDAPEGIEAAA